VTFDDVMMMRERETEKRQTRLCSPTTALIAAKHQTKQPNLSKHDVVVIILFLKR
jgi:hypothetical protein